MLSKGGYLAIADLYKEDGSFHGEKKVPHNGFDMESFFFAEEAWLQGYCA